MKKLITLTFFLFLSAFTFGQTQVSSFTSKTFPPNTSLFTSNNEGELFFFAANHQEKTLLYNSYKEGSNIDSTAFKALRLDDNVKPFSKVDILLNNDIWGLWHLDDQLVLKTPSELVLLSTPEEKYFLEETEEYYFFHRLGNPVNVLTKINKLTGEVNDLPPLVIEDFDQLTIEKVKDVLLWKSQLRICSMQGQFYLCEENNNTWTTDIEGNFLRSMDFENVVQLPCSPKIVHNDSLLIYEDSTFNILLYPIEKEGQPRVLASFQSDPTGWLSPPATRVCNVRTIKRDDLLLISFHNINYRHFFITDYKGSTYVSKSEEYLNVNLYLFNTDLSDGIYTENDSIVYFDALNKLYGLNKTTKEVLSISGPVRNRFYLGKKEGLDYYWMNDKVSGTMYSFEPESLTWEEIDQGSPPRSPHLTVTGYGAYFPVDYQGLIFSFLDLKNKTFSTVKENGSNLPSGNLSLDYIFEDGTQLLSRFFYSDSVSYKTAFNASSGSVVFNKQVSESLPFYIDKSKSQLYYVDSTKNEGIEPFLYDIKSDSTLFLGDLNKSVQSSGLSQYFKFGDDVYGIAKDSNEVYQVWQFDTVSIEEETEEPPVVEEQEPEEEEPTEPETEEPEVIGGTGEEEVVLSSEEATESLIIFPNPVGDVLYIDLSSEVDIYKADIYNVNGSLLKSMEELDSRSLNVEFLSAGTYFILINDDHSLIKKFVKK